MEYLLSWFDKIWSLTILSVNNSPIAVSNIVLGTIFLYLAFKIARKLSELISHKIFPKVIEDATSRRTMESFTYYVFIAFFTLFALNLANIPLTVFAFLGGALAIGVGFGSQNVVNNFFSGLILMIERPVKVDDFIEVDGIFGRVQDIGFRSTKLIGFGNRHMIVPNSFFLEKNVLNWTLSDEMVRTGVTVGVAYGSDTHLVKQKILEAVAGEELIMSEPEPLVLFSDFADSTLNFEVYFSLTLEDLRDMHIVQSNLRFRIDQLFNESGIVIAFPQRDIHIDASHPIPVKIATQASPPS